MSVQLLLFFKKKILKKNFTAIYLKNHYNAISIKIRGNLISKFVANVTKPFLI
jgi:hypothetical protein